MSPKFAQAVDPIFLYVLGLLDRIDRGANPSPQRERNRIRTLIDRAEASLGVGPEWELAKYALVSWVDEVLVDTLWDGRNWWNENVLEIEIFNTRLCNEQFFVKSREAAKLPGRDALEVFYVCVILGFRGLYRDTEPSELNESLEVAQAFDLPGQLRDWTRQTALAIHLGQGRPPLSAPGHDVLGAPPLRSLSSVVWSWLTVLLLLAVAVILAFRY